MIGKGAGRGGFHAGSMGEAVGDLFAIEHAQRVRLRADRRREPLGRRARMPPATSCAASATTPGTSRRTRGVPDAEHLPAGRPAELQRHRLRRDRGRRSTPTARSGSRRTSRSARALAAKYNAAVPGVRPGAADTLRRRRAAGQPVPGQPALDPAAVRLVPARSDRAVDGRRARLDAGRRPDALRRREPERALGRVRAPRPRRLRVVDERHRPRERRRVRHQPDPGLPGPGGGQQRDGEVRRGQPPGAGAGGQGARSSWATTRRACPRSPTPIRRPTRRRARARTTSTTTGFFAPGTYEFVATAPGYGEVRFRRTFRAGQSQTITLRMAPNWASQSQGCDRVRRRDGGDVADDRQRTGVGGDRCATT